MAYAAYRTMIRCGVGRVKLRPWPLAEPWL